MEQGWLKVLVDTSAFYALSVPEDAHHLIAHKTIPLLKDSEVVTTNYVIVESLSLIQNRHGTKAAEEFLNRLLDTLEIAWIDPVLHKEALKLWKKAKTRRLSFVDCSSFAVMRSLGIRKAFAFDSHFTAQGFETLHP